MEVWYFLAVAFTHIDTVAAEECAESAAAVRLAGLHLVVHPCVQLLQKFGAAEGDPLPGQVAELLAKMKAHNLAHPPPAAAAGGAAGNGDEDEDEDDDDDGGDDHGAMVDT